MKKLLLSVLFFVFSASSISAQTPYEITNFSSHLEVNKDTSISVEEKIVVDFNESRHGIIRFIPVIQRSGIKNINTRINNIKVFDENNFSVPFTTSKSGRNIEIKIGDASKYVRGKKVYLISYDMSNVIQRYDNHDEVYWNVVGSGWDTTVNNPEFSLVSEFADIQGVACFTGSVGSTESNCETGYDAKGAIATSQEDVNPGQDFTVVVIFDKQNNLAFPGLLRQIAELISDNWVYLIAFLPALIFIRLWYKKGRDFTYGDKLYYGESSTDKQRFASIFARKHLPTVYRPIDGLSPAQIGTIVDETVHIKDIVAEIVELARLGHLKINQVKKDYDLTYIKKDTSELLDHQQYLLESLFPLGTEKTINTKDFKDLKFYKYLDPLKKKIYESVTRDIKIFDGNPDEIRNKYRILLVVTVIFVVIIFFKFNILGSEPLFFALLSISALISGFLTQHMPRKTARGYAFYRDIIGLKNYVKIGKWRHDIYEKNLFLEEMIPIAISLGVIKKLSNQMKDLGIEAPSYFSTSSGNLSLNNFEKSMSKSVLAGAPSSSQSSWSGGSGFSGGSSGGGFGGGGGSSW